MNYRNLTNDELLTNISRSLKQCKLFQLYVKDMKRDYGKSEPINCKYESIKYEYLGLLKEVNFRGLKLKDEDRGISKILFN